MWPWVTIRWIGGAAWLQHSALNPLARRAEQLGLERRPTHFSQPLAAAWDGPVPDINGAYERLKQAIDRHQPLAQGIDQYLATLNAPERRAARYAIDANLILEAGLPLDQLSTHTLDEEGVGHGDQFLPQGYRQLLEDAASGLNIHLNHPRAARCLGRARRVGRCPQCRCLYLHGADTGTQTPALYARFADGLPRGPGVFHHGPPGKGRAAIRPALVAGFRDGYLRWYDHPANWGSGWI